MLSDVYGQEKAKGFLSSLLLQDRIPNGVLIYGPSRVGKFTLAKSFARALNCRETVRADCDCGSCMKTRNQVHPDVHLVQANDKGNIGIDQIRQDIIEPFSYCISEGKRKVAIIRRAETMQPAAANALLKVLEEPRGDATLILTASNSDSLLDTIKSRCQSVRMAFLSSTILEQLLQRDQQEADPILLELMGGCYSLAQIQDKLTLLGHIFNGSEMEIPEKTEQEALSNELVYVGCLLAYMQRSGLHTFGAITIQRANTDKFERLFSRVQRALDFSRKGVRPNLVIHWLRSQLRGVLFH